MAKDSIELVRRVHEGDRAALDELFRRHLPGLRGYVRLHGDRGLRAREESTDLVQSVCREVLSKLDRFEHYTEGGFRRWLFVTAERTIKNRYGYHLAQKRDVGRETPLPPDDGLEQCYATFVTPSQEFAAREQLQRVEAAFDRLSPSQREIILMARVVGLSHAEIAEEMGRTVEATRALLFRALARLTELLESGP